MRAHFHPFEKVRHCKRRGIADRMVFIACYMQDQNKTSFTSAYINRKELMHYKVLDQLVPILKKTSVKKCSFCVS